MSKEGVEEPSQHSIPTTGAQTAINEFAVAVARGFLRAKKGFALTHQAFIDLAAELQGFGLGKRQSIEFAEWLVVDLVKTTFAAMKANEGEAKPGGSDSPSGGPPPSDDDIPF
jgi:hypothetical protein